MFTNKINLKSLSLIVRKIVCNRNRYYYDKNFKLLSKEIMSYISL